MFTFICLFFAAGDGSRKIKGCWDSIHVIEVQVRERERACMHACSRVCVTMKWNCQANSNHGTWYIWQVQARWKEIQMATWRCKIYTYPPTHFSTHTCTALPEYASLFPLILCILFQEKGKNAHYKLTSTVMLWMQVGITHVSLSLSLSLSLARARARAHAHPLFLLFLFFFAISTGPGTQCHP